jgi:hypothetical protein
MELLRRRLFVYGLMLVLYFAGYVAARGTHMLVFYEHCCGSAVGAGHLDKPDSAAFAAAHVLEVTFWPLVQLESGLRL